MRSLLSQCYSVNCSWFDRLSTNGGMALTINGEKALVNPAPNTKT